MRQRLAEQEFKQLLKDKTNNIEILLREQLPQNPSLQKTIFDAMEYSVMAGGKRLRPLLMQETYLLFGGQERAVISSFMAAMEMIHTYSLVHDDLPAMDNDAFRRGKKTTHAQFGEDMGILAGDALLNYAYETAVNGILCSRKKEDAVRALQILARKAGIYGMVGGQVVDVEMTGKSLNKEQLDFIYRLKTGALLEASFMVGAALAGVSDDMIRVLEETGKNIGYAFQIQDDILDITSTTQELGKPVHSDEKNEKNTYVTVYGMEQAKEAVEAYSEKALTFLEQLPVQSAFLNTLVYALISRKK